MNPRISHTRAYMRIQRMMTEATHRLALCAALLDGRPVCIIEGHQVLRPPPLQLLKFREGPWREL